jgi:hypothetical protein
VPAADEVRGQALEVARGWSPPGAPRSWRLTAALFEAIAADDDLLGMLAALPADRLPALLGSAPIAFLVRRDRPGPLGPAGPHSVQGLPRPPRAGQQLPARRGLRRTGSPHLRRGRRPQPSARPRPPRRIAHRARNVAVSSHPACPKRRGKRATQWPSALSTQPTKSGSLSPDGPVITYRVQSRPSVLRTARSSTEVDGQPASLRRGGSPAGRREAAAPHPDSSWGVREQTPDGRREHRTPPAR